MDAVDAMVFALLALADIILFIHLRRRRARMMRVKRMYHTLTLSVRRELAVAAPTSGKVPMEQRRAAAKALLRRSLLKPSDFSEASAQ